MLRSGNGIFLLSEEFDVVLEVGRVLLTIGHLDVVGESPGFGVEDGALFLLVVVGRGTVDFEKGWSGRRRFWRR